jgi:hypothetical protein
MTKKKLRGDRKVNISTHKRARRTPVIKHGVPQPGITKKEFMDVLTKASQPIEHESQPDLGKSET